MCPSFACWAGTPFVVLPPSDQRLGADRGRSSCLRQRHGHQRVQNLPCGQERLRGQEKRRQQMFSDYGDFVFAGAYREERQVIYAATCGLFQNAECSLEDMECHSRRLRPFCPVAFAARASDSWRPPWRWTFRRNLYRMANLDVSCDLSKSISSHSSSNVSHPVCFDLLLAVVNILKIFRRLCQQMRSLNILWALCLGCPCVKGAAKYVLPAGCGLQVFQ